MSMTKSAVASLSAHPCSLICGRSLHGAGLEQHSKTGSADENMHMRCCDVQPKKVSAEELEVALADRDVPLIVDFYATW